MARWGAASARSPSCAASTSFRSRCWVPGASGCSDAGPERLVAGEQRTGIAELKRALRRTTYDLEIAEELLWGWESACASPGLVSSRRGLQALGGGACGTDQPRGDLPRSPSPSGSGLTGAATGPRVRGRDRRDGAGQPDRRFRMVGAWARRRLGSLSNRKRVLRLMHEPRPIQRLDFRTPLEVAATWSDGGPPTDSQRPDLSTPQGSRSDLRRSQAIGPFTKPGPRASPHNRR
jgi:hypothetical protein